MNRIQIENHEPIKRRIIQNKLTELSSQAQ